MRGLERDLDPHGGVVELRRFESRGRLHTTVGTSWSEGAVTWATAPAAQAATLAALGAVAAGATISIPVTAAVTGDGAVGFRLTSSSSDGRALLLEGGQRDAGSEARRHLPVIRVTPDVGVDPVPTAGVTPVRAPSPVGLAPP